MGKRSRKQRAATAPAPRPSRSEAKNAAVREQLEPLGPGERPLAVTIGAVVVAISAVANVALFLGGQTIQGKRPATGGIIIFSALMFSMAWGLWRAKYWAVLGLEALLGIILVVFSLLALRSSSVTEALIAVAVLAIAGALFWFLIRAMARIQMPQRPTR